MNFLERLMRLWMAWVLPRPRLVLGVAFLAALASLVYTSMRLGIQTDQLELISTDHPLISLSDKLQPFNFDGKRLFIVVVKGSNPDESIAFSKMLVSRIQEDKEYFKEVIYRVDPELIKRWALLYLDREDLAGIGEKITEHADLVNKLAENPDILTFLDLTNRKMASRMVGELFTGFLDDGEKDQPDKKSDPMDLGFLIETLEGFSNYLRGSLEYTSPWFAFFKSEAWDFDREGYFWENGKKLLILTVVPQKRGQGFAKTQGSLEQLRMHIREVGSLFPDLEAGVTGQEALNNDEMTTVMADMNLATWLSLAGLSLLMIIAFRGIRRPLVQMVSLGVGLCWSFGWTTLFIGHLNILSAVFGPLLCGLGEDYGVHWFMRYDEEDERRPDLETRDLIHRVMMRSGIGILLAGLSGALSFVPFILTGFRGLIELGFITGMGMLLILLADFTVLPALSVFMAGRRNGSRALRNIAPDKDLLRFNRVWARIVIVSIAGLCIACYWGISRVQFDLNPLRLQAANAESVIWEKVLLENAEHPLLSASSFASSPGEVASKAGLFSALPAVESAKSVFDLLPEKQEEKLPILHELRPLIPEIRRVDVDPRSSYIGELVGVLEKIRFKMQDDQADKWGADKPLVAQMTRVRELAKEIIGTLNGHTDQPKQLIEYRRLFTEDLADTWEFLREGTNASIMTVEDIPPVLKDQFFRNGQYLIRIFPRESIWEQDALSRFVSQAQSVDPDIVGDPVSLYVFATAYKKACVMASIYALIAIFALLIVTLRDIVLTLLALLPLIIGSVLTVGIMGLTGFHFNLANSIFMPIVVGAGVEYGIIILARWKEGNVRPGHLPLSTGMGIILAALTTTVGFGMLMISHHRGIFSLGFVAWVGSLCVMLSAILLLPAILAGMKSPKAIAVKELRDEDFVDFCIDRHIVVGERCPDSGPERGRRG